MTEAEVSLQRCSDLMAKHDVTWGRTAAAVSNAQKPAYSTVAITAAEPAGRAVNLAFTGCLARTIATFFECKCSRSRSLQWKFSGRPGNTAAAAMAFEVSYNLALAWSMSRKSGERRSYCLGLAHGLFARAERERAERQTELNLVDQVDRQCGRQKEIRGLIELAGTLEGDGLHLRHNLHVLTRRSMRYHQLMIERLAHAEEFGEEDINWSYHQHCQLLLARKHLNWLLYDLRRRRKIVFRRVSAMKRENDAELATILDQERRSEPEQNAIDRLQQEVRTTGASELASLTYHRAGQGALPRGVLKATGKAGRTASTLTSGGNRWVMAARLTKNNAGLHLLVGHDHAVNSIDTCPDVRPSRLAMTHHISILIVHV